MPLSSRTFSLTRPDGTLKTADEMQHEADTLIRDAQARGERMRAEIADNVVEATSKNQTATVSVTAGGTLQSVRLSDRIKGMGAAMLSAWIMEAYREACCQATARTSEIAGREIGEERAANMLSGLLPKFDDADEEARP